MPPRKRAPSPSESTSPSKRLKPDPYIIDLVDSDDEPEKINSAYTQNLAGRTTSPASGNDASGSMGNPISIDYDEDAALRWAMEESTKAEASGSVAQPSSSSSAVRNQAPVEDTIVLDDDPEDAEMRWAMEESMKTGSLASTPQQQVSAPAPLLSIRKDANSPPSNAPLPSYRDSEGDEPPNVRLESHLSLFNEVKTCSSCSKLFELPETITIFSAHEIPPTLAVSLHLICKPCKRVHCRGCMSVHSCTLSCKGPSHTNSPSCSLVTCCAEVRAVALYEALSGFDQLYNTEKENAAQRAHESAASNGSKTAGSVGPGGTGYGTDAGMISYGGGPPFGFQSKSKLKYKPFYLHDNIGPRGGTPPRVGDTTTSANSRSQGWDAAIVRALQTITALLPAPYSDSPGVYDLLPHASTGPLLSLSLLPTLLSDLLRNDSVTDWSARADVYQATLGLLRRLADSELTIGVLIERPFERKAWEGLRAWASGDERERAVEWVRKPAAPAAQGKGKGKQRDSQPPVYERGVPLYAHFKKLLKQCETFLSSAAQLMDGSGGAEEEMAIRATSLCGDVVAAHDAIQRAMAVLGRAAQEETGAAEAAPDAGHSHATRGKGAAKGKGVDESVELERRYSRACEKLAFAHVTLSEPGDADVLNYPFAFNNEVQQSFRSTRTPKNRLHLIKELSTLATSLPPGVWIRVDEVRNDVVKIMIAGPVDTPYEGGLFEFDCFLPLEYPQVAPKMHLRTTGGGSVRFNPNLYNCGKVCLSLLGTWPGRPEEQWQPGRSTLLQIIVSIQSMILIDMPYFNEPGHGQANPKSTASQSYNKNIRAQTTRWAIVDWMKPENRQSIWADVIFMHFTLREAKIRSTLEKWAKNTPALRSYTTTPSSDRFYYDEMGAAQRYNNRGGSMQGGVDLLADFANGIKCIRQWQDGDS